MKALVYEGLKTLRYKSVPDPAPQDNESLIRVEAVGICGSDMHAFLGHDDRRPPPLILGHEASGVVAKGAQSGMRVAINPLVSCGHCIDCRAGRGNLCADRQIISMPPRQGAFAEMTAIPDRNLFELPDDLSSVVAALTEPVATGLHAVCLAHRITPRPISEGKALVIGGGAVGLSAALVLASHGCREIYLSDTNKGRLETAKNAGALIPFDPTAEDGPDDGSVDVIIDAVGAKQTREAAILAARPGAVIVHVGLLDGKGGVDVRRLTLQEITLIGSYTYTMSDFGAALKLLSSGALGNADWFETRSLESGATAFDDLNNRRVDAAKIVLMP